MTVVFTLLTLAVLGVVAAVAVGRIGGGLDEPASSLPSRGLGSGPVAPEDLDALRFSPALRGYRMDEVDAVLDQVGEELRRRDEEIARLRSALADAEPLGTPEGFTRPYDGVPLLPDAGLLAGPSAEDR